LETGDGNVTVVTNYSNVEAGQLVIVAPEGSTVCGKQVKRAKVAGEFSMGTLCGPMEMGWKGDASSCVILDNQYHVGDFAPANQAGAKTGGAKSPPAANCNVDEGDDDDDDASNKKKGKKGKAAAAPAPKAKGKRGKHNDDEDGEEEDGHDLAGEDDEDEDRKPGKKKAGSQPVAKAKGKKGKVQKDQQDDEAVGAAVDDSDDDKRKRGKAGKKK